MLHSVTGVPKGRRCWCGPAALAIITGQRYDAMLALLGDVAQRSRVMGVHDWEMRAALRATGWEMMRVPANPDLTLAAWMRARSANQQAVLYLVCISRSKGHYVVVQGRKAADNHTKAPVWLTDFPHRRKRINQVHAVHTIGGH